MSNVRSKISLLFAIILSISESISAQTVKNVYAMQAGNDILVNYTLETSSQCEVSLFCSSDSGLTWQGPLTDCTGDVGKNISGGQKQIKWKVLASREQLVGKGFQFKIKANARKEFEPEMVFVDGGTFQMGSNSGDSGEKPIHTVELSSFSIGKYEVTQAQWKVVMGNNPSYSLGCDQCPVEQVSWSDIQVFILKINQLTGKTYRLPTEAEWEYAARGGKESKGYLYSGSDDIEAVAWYANKSPDKAYKSPDKAHPVGLKKPNELGIYDMSGNVWEWCSDWAEKYPSDKLNNPKGPYSGDERIMRGGSWFDERSSCRSSCRSAGFSEDWEYPYGFRLVLP